MDLLNLFAEKKEKDKKTVIEMPEDYNLLNQTIQDFMPFEDVRDSMIVLPNHLYRAVIEVKSINYYLKTAQEQDSIEAMFKSALGSWDFSYAFYTQTRTIDADDVVRRLKEDVQKVTTKELKAYGTEYIENMKSLTKAKNGNLIKRNYIIVSCNDAEGISNNKTQEDFDSYAFDRLNLNTRKVHEALAPIGLTCHTLSNEELIEFLFVAINKHSILKANEILAFTTNITAGKTNWDARQIDLLLDGTINKLQMLVNANHDMSSNDYERVQELIDELQKLKNSSKEKENDLFVL